MSFGLDTVLPLMLNAAKEPLSESWQTTAPFAEKQFTEIAERIQLLGEDVALGSITSDEALLILDMEKQASISALAALEGIGKVTAETAINNALDAVANIVNKSVGFVLL